MPSLLWPEVPCLSTSHFGVAADHHLSGRGGNMFGHQSSPSQIYSYGAQAPTTNGALVEAQLRAAHRYRNDLVELERSRRTRVAEAIQAHDPGLQTLEAE